MILAQDFGGCILFSLFKANIIKSEQEKKTSNLFWNSMAFLTLKSYEGESGSENLTATKFATLLVPQALCVLPLLDLQPDY